ncbi:uncharacterized protein LOC116502429 [Thamnophis elegans]|uniref:uncharacterized protein LOC116502429 n=1 Tax=Thamnophis elegans TaxID=35005 RepID=UPI001376A6C1|nr:uncharacterized protein LOC116502429 [Thamnophis elegans]
MGGTFQNQIIDDLTSLIAANEERYPNQFPYIDQWGDAVAGQADELLQCQAEMVRLCVVRPKEKGKLRSAPRRTIKIAASETKESEKKRIFAQDEEELFRPPPPYASAPVGIVVPQAMGAAAVADSGDKDSAVGTGDPQATGGAVRRKEPKEGGLGATGIRREGPVTRRLGVERAKAEKEESTLLEEKEGLFPLRVSEQQVGVDAQGDPEYRPCFQYIPFSTTDLLNWRKHFGLLSVKPTEMTDLFQTIMHSHNPNWRDIQQLLTTLLTAEEREKCKAGMREVFRERYHTEADRAQKLLEEALERDPGWDPKVAGDLAKIQTYQTLIVAALKKAGKPPVNLSKPSLVMQGADESPEAFLQRLIEAYELYTQMDPRAPENVRMLNERFIAQSALDIRKKLQRLEGALGKNTTELVEVARKVYVNRDKTPPEPMVTLNIGGQQTTFLVDTGAGRSVINNPITTPGPYQIQVQGVSGQVVGRQVLKPVTCTFKGSEIQHEFLYIPECPVPLLGRDLLSKLGATISFDEGKQYLTVSHRPDEMWRLMVVRTSEEECLDVWREFDVPGLWAEDNPPGFAAHHPPIIVELKPLATPVHIGQQRPYWREAILSIYDCILTYLDAGVLVPIQSPWNTPILPILKPDGSFRPVQDLRVVNDRTVTIHPSVSNPYTLLSLIPPNATWFSVIDLKDAFFTIPIHPVSQPLFAFEWENPYTGTRSQYTWTRLPQGFKNSPTLFGTALAKDLQYFIPFQQGDSVLQYVDDVLVTGQSRDGCWENTRRMLCLLLDCGYRASRSKAQLVQQKVRYLGYDIMQGQRALGPERKQALLNLARPTDRRQLRGFLGLAGFCRIWIPNYALMAAPLYSSTKGSKTDPFIWTKEQDQAFDAIKEALLRAPALALPNLSKPFNLYVDTRKNVALGVLTQQLGQWQQPVAYLSKQLDAVAQGWPHCLKALAAIAELLQDCNKLTFSCPIRVHTPHSVQAILDQKGHLWISNQRIIKYQAMMIENPQVHLVVSTSLNPATLLPTETEVEHDCVQVLETVYSTRPDLTDIPLPQVDYNWYTDGSSYIHQGMRVAGYAIVDDEGVIESGPLGAGKSAQVAELWALIRALERAEGERLNVWTDSKYAFLTLHAHGAVYKERGFRDSAGKYIQHSHLIQRLIDAVQKPKKEAVMHCRGHQRGDDRIVVGNRTADAEARAAALRHEPLPDIYINVALDLGVIPVDIQPSYSLSECDKAVNDLMAVIDKGWYVLPDGRIYVPSTVAWQLVRSTHETTHMGKTALESALMRDYYIDGLAGMAVKVASSCETCAKVNPRQGPSLPPGTIPIAYYPMDTVMIDFTDMPRSGFYRAMLVIVDLYTGWPEAFPTRTKKAQEVAKVLLKEIIPRFGNPS